MMGRTSLLDLEHSGSHREPFLPIFAQGATQGTFLREIRKETNVRLRYSLKEGEEGDSECSIKLPARYRGDLLAGYVYRE
jgi:hypothetical protein